MKNFVHAFLDWWKDAPAWQSIWFVPLVLVLWLIAIIKNSITGEK
jgi:hypothetical protein